MDWPWKHGEGKQTSSILNSIYSLITKGICKNLVEKGQLDKPLIIFNRTQKRATDLSSSLPSGKSIVAPSIEDLVSKSDIIFTCVGDDAAINDTIDTALKSNAKGKLFVDCSTVHPEIGRAHV